MASTGDIRSGYGLVPQRLVPQAAADGTPPVVAVRGGAGSAAAVVVDVDLLGDRLAAVRSATDLDGAAALLAQASAQAQALWPVAPAEAAAAVQACLGAIGAVASSGLELESLVRSAQLAAMVYAGTEEAITRAWHLVTGTTVPTTLALCVTTAAAHEGLGATGLGPLEAASCEATLDGLAQRVPVGDRPADVREGSALQRLTAVLGDRYTATGVEVVPLPDRTPSPFDPQAAAAARPGLEGLVAGVQQASAGDDHVVAVRDRVVDGPDGRHHVYVVDLPGTDTWTGPTRRGDSPMDLGSGLTQLGAADDDAYVEAVLMLVRQAPPGSHVVLVGHSLGGITASTVAALAARRGVRVDAVVTAGAPVDTMRVPRGTTVVSLANDADLVPSADGMPARSVAGRTTVVVDDDRGSAGENHSLEVYVGAARAADRLARTDPGLAATSRDLRSRGILPGEGDVVQEKTRRYRLTRRP